MEPIFPYTITAFLFQKVPAVKLYIEKKKKDMDRKSFIDRFVEPAKKRRGNHGPGSNILGDMENKK